MLVVFQIMGVSEEEARVNKLEHAKFLLYQIQHELSLYRENKDCIVQCEDGSLHTSSVLLLSISNSLRLTWRPEEEVPVIIMPGLAVGELLLFFKYIFSQQVQEMFNKEDVSVIDKVFQLFNVEEIIKKDEDRVENSVSPLVRQTQSDKKSSEKKSKFREKRLKQLSKLENELPCIFCRETIGFSLFGKHVRLKHPEKENSCKVCGKVCETKESLEIHVQCHGDTKYYLLCERCDRVCLTQYQLQVHKKGHNIKNFESHACDQCDRVFKVKDKLLKHIEQHKTGSLDVRHPCSICDKVFKRGLDLKRHEKSHSGIKNYCCETCGAKFVDGTRLKQHKWIHTDLKQFKCPECLQCFRLNSHLRSHMASFHPETEGSSKAHSCQFCKKVFAFEYKLTKHLKWHEMDQIERIEYDNNEYSISSMNVVE